MQKVLRFLCGLVLLLTMFSPLIDMIDTWEVRIPEILQEAENSASLESQQEEAAFSGAYGYIANTWMQLLAEECAIAPEKITVTFYTNDRGELTGAEVLLSCCPYVKRRQAEEILAKRMQIPVTVKGE